MIDRRTALDRGLTGLLGIAARYRRPSGSVIWFLVFVFFQLVILFMFYRLVLKPLPGQINDFLFRRHLENEFIEVAQDTARLLRDRLLRLEQERIDAVVRYEAVKGKRLDTTAANERTALKKSVDQLERQIRGLQAEISEMYATDVLSNLAKFEQLRLVRAVNRYLDAAQKARR